MTCDLHDRFAPHGRCPWCVVAVLTAERDLARQELAQAVAKLESFEASAEARIVELEEAARVRLACGHDALCESLDSRRKVARPCSCGHAELARLMPDE